ncbi:DNA excision repair protein ERCC-4 [Nematocida minor]|uniref:DNA excision repair protein ERCC-4 n=1 Tax=Nematocida minor TaxID=1912983 RepID=UPI00221FB634|nr:DNA excision repair protein ERCC-4 [Nematocida minor]KAI5190560.1 DNA excision repair protein ERCC-4 [Nematocida minor]
MHSHEKRIVKEVLSWKRTIHMVYNGARVGVILKEIIRKTDETLVVIGAPRKYIEVISKSRKNKGDKSSTEKIKACRIDTKTSTKQRKAIYTGNGCVFVSEHIFLSDILKDNTPSSKMRLLYLLGSGAMHPSKTIMDFILFALKASVSILFSWSPEYSFPELVSKGYFPSAGIFLYPSFRKSVAQSMGDFEINEITISGGNERELIQHEILEVIKKVENILGKSALEGYIQCTAKLLQMSLSILYNASIDKFIEFFGEITDVNNNMKVLVKQLGVPDSMHARNTVYSSALGWMVLSQIEEIKQTALHIKEKEKISPKENVLMRVLQKEKDKNIAIIAHKLPKELFSSSLPVQSSKKIISIIRNLVKTESPHVVFLNYSIDLLRKFKLCRERWRKRGIEIELTVITIKNSVEEVNLFESMHREKDHFVSAIGIKQNRPKMIDRKVFTKTPDDPKAPVIQIDMRELRSKLPLHLAQHFTNTFRLEFEMLKIGDYVLNSTYYIERKRIDDFVSSLGSGRLFKQLQALEFSHGSSYLLIEFPDTNKISFLNYTNRMHEMDLTVKIVKLLLSIKSMYIFYSSTERHSTALINALARKPPREIQKKTKAYSPSITESLLAIPGIDHRNIEIILNNFASLYDLITSEESRLIGVLGNELGQKTFSFFNSIG